MIADIRFFARPPQPEPITFNLIEELEKLVAEQMPLMAESGVTFHAELDPQGDLPDDLMVKTDPVLLHVAVNVLCNNAREAVQFTGGTVWLSLRHADNVWEIVVKDDGHGISEEIRPLIFDPYYSGRQAGRGLGFGLPKAWRIMQLLGGSIRHETESTFILTLPTSENS
jgi:signal transduction histidine kinase